MASLPSPRHRRRGVSLIRRGQGQGPQTHSRHRHNLNPVHGYDMATYDTIALSPEQRDLAKEARKCLKGNAPYTFSKTSEELYRSLIAVVFRKLRERNPNFQDVQKVTISLPKNEPLQNDKWETMVVVQLPCGDTDGIVKVLDKIGADDCKEFEWGSGDAFFVPKGWTLMAKSDAIIIDMWLFLLKDQEA